VWTQSENVLSSYTYTPCIIKQHGILGDLFPVDYLDGNNGTHKKSLFSCRLNYCRLKTEVSYPAILITRRSRPDGDGNSV